MVLYLLGFKWTSRLSQWVDRVRPNPCWSLSKATNSKQNSPDWQFPAVTSSQLDQMAIVAGLTTNSPENDEKKWKKMRADQSNSLDERRETPSRWEVIILWETYAADSYIDPLMSSFAALEGVPKKEPCYITQKWPCSYSSDVNEAGTTRTVILPNQWKMDYRKHSWKKHFLNFEIHSCQFSTVYLVFEEF